MVENSENSAQSGKRSTRRASVTPAQLLEILQQAVINCQQAGYEVSIAPLYKDGEQLVTIIFRNITIVDGNLVTSTGNGAPA